MDAKEKAMLIGMMLLLPMGLSVQIDPGVQIQPNASKSYYVVNNTFYVDDMKVYEDYVTLAGLDDRNTTVSILKSDGSVESYISDLKKDVTLPQISTVKNIYFQVSQAAITYYHRYGAGIVSEKAYQSYNLVGLLPFIIGAMALIGVIVGVLVIK